MRGGSKITRNDYMQSIKGDRVDWLDQFAERFAAQEPKDAVEAARDRDRKANSVYDQISEIMGGKSRKNSTVQGVVNEYRERLGLDKLSQSNNSVNVKMAEITSDSSQIFNNVSPKVKQQILENIDSIINKYNGNIAPSAVANTLLNDTKYQLRPEDVKSNFVQKYISDRLVVFAKQHPSHEDNANPFKKDTSEADDNDLLFSTLQANK